MSCDLAPWALRLPVVKRAEVGCAFTEYPENGYEEAQVKAIQRTPQFIVFVHFFGGRSPRRALLELDAMFAKICQKSYLLDMGTMNISLPESLKDFVDEQVVDRGYGTSSEYVRELLRREQEKIQLKKLLLKGAASRPGAPIDGAYFEKLRRKVGAKSAKSSLRKMRKKSAG